MKIVWHNQYIIRTKKNQSKDEHYSTKLRYYNFYSTRTQYIPYVLAIFCPYTYFYIANFFFYFIKEKPKTWFVLGLELVGNKGFEPLTSSM